MTLCARRTIIKSIPVSPSLRSATDHGQAARGVTSTAPLDRDRFRCTFSPHAPRIRHSLEERDLPLRQFARRRAQGAAKRIYDANNGVNWGTPDGILARAELKLFEAALQNQSASWFSTEDIMTGLQQYGPLLFSGMFVRVFGKRFRSYGHVILVYGVDYDKVWYHDPAIGLEAAKASISLEVDTFKNGWNPEASKMLTVHAVDPAFVRAKAADAALAAHVAARA
jgi:hypothetical protein